MKTRCIAVWVVLWMAFLVVGCGNTGSAEEIQDSPADLTVFPDLETFTVYAASAEEKETDAAELVSLRAFFVPAGIPEGYQLYKITAGIADIGFWYLPEECLSSADAILEAEAGQKHFLFMSTRGTYEFGSVITQFSAVQDDLLEGKYLVREGADRMVIWEQDHVVLMLYLPADYEADGITSLCKADEYIKNEETHTFERVDLH